MTVKLSDRLKDSYPTWHGWESAKAYGNLITEVEHLEEDLSKAKEQIASGSEISEWPNSDPHNVLAWWDVHERDVVWMDQELGRLQGRIAEARRLLLEPVQKKRIRKDGQESWVVQYDYVIDEAWLDGWRDRFGKTLSPTEPKAGEDKK